MRQIEELYTEETIIKDLECGELECDFKSNCKLKDGGIKLYDKWSFLVENSKIEFLKLHLNDKDALLKNFKSKLNANENISILKIKDINIDIEQVVDFTESSYQQVPTNQHIKEVESQFSKESEMIKTSAETKSKEISNSKSIAELNNSSAMQEDLNVLCEPLEFIKCIDKLLVSTQTVDKHLDNIQKPNKEFFEFEKQDLKLNAIKETLESLAMALKTSLLHKNAILEKSNKETSKKLSKAVSALTKRHHDVVVKYKEKNTFYIKNYEKLTEFENNFQSIQTWLSLTLSKINTLKTGSDLNTDGMLDIIKDFSNLTSYRLLLEKTYLGGSEIINRSNELDAQNLSVKLNNLNNKWKELMTEINNLKEK